MSKPLKQFEIKKLVDIDFAGFDLSFTNSSLMMVLALALITLFLFLSVRKRSIKPGKLQAASEMLYELISNMINSTAGEKARPLVPFAFSLFMFILTANLIGIIPYSFTVTSHIAVTFTLAAFIFIGITVLGFIIQGRQFFRIFCPPGLPTVLIPIIVVIELFSYLARPISLSLRLAANMIAGHIVLKVVASFIIMAGFLGVVPFTLLTIVTGFEIFIAILQAYIFTILACVYLSDAFNAH